jgi:hypothetical protein
MEEYKRIAFPSGFFGDWKRKFTVEPRISCQYGFHALI